MLLNNRHFGAIFRPFCTCRKARVKGGKVEFGPATPQRMNDFFKIFDMLLTYLVETSKVIIVGLFILIHDGEIF